MKTMTNKVKAKPGAGFVAKGGPAAVAKGPTTPPGKGIVAVRNRMPKAK